MKSKDLRTIRELLLDGRAVDLAMRKAVKAALLRHRRAGVPFAVWRSGEVARIEPRRLVSRARSVKGSRAPR